MTSSLPRLTWTPQAESDLVEIYVLIGLERPAVAERYYDRLRDKARILRDYPRLGTRRPDIGPGARIMVEHPYLLVYRIHPDDEDAQVAEVEFIRVIDGRRELGPVVKLHLIRRLGIRKSVEA